MELQTSARKTMQIRFDAKLSAIYHLPARFEGLITKTPFKSTEILTITNIRLS
jgi:hypothetical protein